MIIRKRAIISWLLDPDITDIDLKFGIKTTSNLDHFSYLRDGLDNLNHVRSADWGLPELLMPSFETIMNKCAKSFFNIEYELFKEFSNEGICGILLSSKDSNTIIYGFGNNTLYVWVFQEIRGNSILYLYFCVESHPDNKRILYTHPTLTTNQDLISIKYTNPNEIYNILINRLIIYLAVKKHAKVDTIVIPTGTLFKLDDTIKEHTVKNKIKNESGQEVIIMDSRWLRRIINDNDIFVRGFFRLQNKKDKTTGNWYKELIFVDSYIRHGYHRNAKINGQSH